MTTASQNTHIVNDQVFALRKKSKYSWEAINGNEESITTAPSRPKLKSKLDNMFKAKSERPEVKVEKTPKKKAKKSKDTNKNRVSKKNKPESMRAATLRMILEGDDDENILKYVQSNHPDAKYDKRHVKWYRSNFAKTGIIDAEFAPRGSEMYKEWAATA